ncbi:hypothetical protein WN59_05025 [Salinicoccus sediminis]|uniref:Uncharacterized protein n=2 Tax=Salinicoccus sediminis TaxID=1432562 RepID=A0A0M2SQV5_9STAP|nr:hypothetical protein WN59_05025 [Salinicoccus sediminis]
MKKWKFPNGKDLTPSGHNNTAIEMFLDNIINSLTREVVQNSLDAHNPEMGAPVKVTFNEFLISKNDIPGYDEIKDFALPRAIEMWTEHNNEDTLDYLSRFNEVLTSGNIKVLKISDYNTRGLNQNSYESLVIGNAYSVKENADSAGSKGIGKAAPFAASDLRMVFYNTVPTHDVIKSVGIMNFVSFLFEENENHITQERASFILNDKDFIPEQTTFGLKKRAEDEYGTDLFIIGLKELEDMGTSILLSAINNFLISIIKNELEIEVGEVVLNNNSLEKILKNLTQKELKGHERAILSSTLSFYDVMTNENTIKLNLNETFDQFSFIENREDATLFLLQHSDATRTVLQTRKAGMKIYERNRISGSINFTGVFKADGKELNTLLKDMENANHNIWSTDRLRGSRKAEAEKFLKALYKWYKESVKEAYETTMEDDIEAFGVKDLLPLREQETQENDEESRDSGIINKISNIYIDRKSPSNQVKNGEREEEEVKEDLELTGVGLGDTSGPGSNRTGEAGGNSPGNEYGFGEADGNTGPDESGSTAVISKRNKISVSKNVKMKVLERDSKKGRFKLVGKSDKNIDKCRIELSSIGGDGRAFPMTLLEVASEMDENSATIENNDILITNIKKNEYFRINIEIDSKIRIKMESVVYEIKS